MVVVRRRPRLIGRTVSHYRILEHLGGGGMGVVYRAEDSKLSRIVALKFLAADLTRNPSAKERFLREARAASALDHPAICTIYEVDETLEGQLYIAMAYYDGETLEERIFRGPLPAAEAIDIAVQIARGLGRAHESGIIHRDVKPANIIVTQRGEAKIVDFGLAKLAGQVGLTRHGAAMGTPTYMSPEQADGREVDTRSDIWSLGVILYEMVTGRKPFVGEDAPSIIYALLHHEPEAPHKIIPNLPPAISRVIAGCLSKDPERRFSSCQAVIAALAPLLDSSQEVTIWSPAAAAALGLPPPPTAAGWPPLAKATAITLAVLLLAGGALYFWRPRPTSLAAAAAASSSAAGASSNAAGASSNAVGAGSVGSVAETPKRIAVLPFENLGPPGDAFFANGITEEITSRLAAIHGLAVISHTSATRYGKASQSLKAIGAELRVDYVLEGSVRWQRLPGGGSRVRVTPQLIRVADDTHLWAGEFDRAGGEIFQLQSEIAEQVIRQLDITLLQPERQALAVRSTTNLDAYQAYLRGHALLAGLGPVYSAAAGRQAAQAFERAVLLDPKFAEAWAGLSLTLSATVQGGFDPSRRSLERAKEAVDRALALSPQLPDAHIAMGYYHYWGFRAYEPAIRELQIAARLGARQGEVAEAMGYLRRRQGRLEEAISEFNKAIALDPRNANLALSLGQAETLLRHYDRAEIYMDLAIAIDPGQALLYFQKSYTHLLAGGSIPQARTILLAAPPSDDPLVELARFWLDTYERHYDDALARLEKIPFDFFEEPDSTYPRALLFGLLHRLRGEPALARTAFEQSRQRLEREVADHPRDGRRHGALALSYAGLGRRDEALREGKLAVELAPPQVDAIAAMQRRNELAQTYGLLGDVQGASEQLGYLLSHPTLLSLPLVDLNPLWDPMRKDPRFQAALRLGR